jgi:predicted SAM-dependent methyltransferase
MWSTMKLNLGSNRHALEGHINADIALYPEADIVCDAAHAPFPTESISEIYAGHLLEHMDDPLGFFIESHRLLVRGGQLMVVVPDPTKSTTDDPMTIGSLFGFWLTDDLPDPDIPIGMHRTWWTAELLHAVGCHMGFSYERAVDPWEEENLVIGADWHVGIVFKKSELDPTIKLAYEHYHRILFSPGGDNET